jgi:phosphoribosyl 1,2-cyclic phosphodiesterase
MSRYGGATACVAIEHGDGDVPIVLDLGTGARRLGEHLLARYSPLGSVLAGALPSPVATDTLFDSRFGLDDAPLVPQPHARPLADPALEVNVFATHLHFDHIQGLPFFGPALRPDSRVSIYGPRQTGSSLSEVFAAFIRPPYFPVGLHDLPAELCFFEVGDGEVKLGSSRVIVREVPHVGLTVGYRVETDGVSVAYVSDHQAPAEDGAVIRTVSESVLELCDGVDLLIHDAQYTNEEFAVKAHWGHSTLAYAAHVAREAGARRLALFHHDPTHDDATLDSFGREADLWVDGRLEEIVMAAEGSSITLDPASGAYVEGATIAEKREEDQ